MFQTSRALPLLGPVAALWLGTTAGPLLSQGSVVVHHRLVGDPTQFRFGYSLAGGADLNGDGCHDFLIGGDGYSPGGISLAGSVFLYSGKDAALLRRFDGFREHGRIGHSVAFAGDVDGDGIDDVLAGGPFAAYLGASYAGMATVWSGRDGQVLHLLFGGDKTDQFGHGVSALDDVDGDGHDDFAVGAPWAGPRQTGEVQVYSGGTGQVLWSYRGDAKWSATGYTLSSLGDVDGDGLRDLLAGAHAANPFGVLAPLGEVHLLSGADGQLIRRFTSYPAHDPHDLFGFGVSGVADLDGDQRDDLVVGAPYANAGGLVNNGISQVISSATGDVIYEWHGTRMGERFGRAVMGSGDMDGDGVSEVVVSSGHLPPFPYFGEPYSGGSCYVYSGADGSLIERFEGEFPPESPGQFLGYAGDVNGDGRNDLLAGSPYPVPNAGQMQGPGLALVLGLR